MVNCDLENIKNYPRSSPGVESEDDPSSGCFMTDVCVRDGISRHGMIHERGTRCQVRGGMGTGHQHQLTSRHAARDGVTKHNKCHDIVPGHSLVSSNCRLESVKWGIIYI